MGISAALIGLGSWLTAGAATGIIAGAIGGAVVGAAIGGLTAAIAGGNILEGVLFGAVGGAISGGIGAWAGGGVSGAGMAVEGAEAAGYATQHIPGAAGTVATTTSSISSGLSTIGTNMIKEGGQKVIGTVIEKGLHGYLGAEAGEAAGEAALALSAQEHEQRMEQIAASDRGFDPAGMANVAVRRKELELQRQQYEEGRDVLAKEKAEMRESFKGYGQRQVALEAPEVPGTSLLTKREDVGAALATPTIPSVAALKEEVA